MKEGSKVCPHCKQCIPLDGFYKNKNKPDGLAIYCKQCAKSFSKSSYEKNKRNTTPRKPKPENSLAINNPVLATYWAEENTMSALEISKSSTYCALWHCKECDSKWSASVNTMQTNKRICQHCAHKQKDNLLNKESRYSQWWDDEKPLSDFTSGARYKAQFKCPEKGHVFLRQLRHFNFSCPHCRQYENSLLAKSPALAKQYRGEVPVDEISYNSARVVSWQCPCDRKTLWQTTVYQRFNGNSTTCPVCSNSKQSSDGEKEVFDYVKSILGVNVAVEENNRSVLDGKELDIYIPDRNIAIEYNGLYWHSEKNGKDRNYHKNKHSLCAKAGVQLITIWEDDWRDKNAVVKKMITHKLGVSKQETIYARNTYVSSVDKNKARDFCNNNHIQGFTAGSFYLGLFDKNSNELVAVSIWRKLKDTLYLDRYCTSSIVSGGMGKLLKAAKETGKEISCSAIVTFADKEISNGNLYENLGFEVDKVLKPDYKYLYKGSRVHKFNFRKKRFKESSDLLYKENLTETELAALNNIPRIWDCGKTRYVMNI